MKNAKYAVIALACVCLICVGFFFFTESNKSQEEDLTEIEKILVKDLEKDYPKTPREVVKLYNRIVKAYYGGEATDEQIEKLVDRMLYLLDEELLAVNSRDEYYASVLSDIQSYKDKKKTITTTDVCSSNEVKYVTDKKSGTEKADYLAYVNASYFIKTDGSFANAYQQFVLREDEDGKWKILTFYEVEGESSDDE